MMLLLDTNAVSHLTADPEQDNAQRIRAILAQYQAMEYRVAASEITRGEIEYGLRLGNLAAAAVTRIRTGLQAISLWLPVNAEVAEKYGELKARLFNRYAGSSAHGRMRGTRRVNLLPVPPVYDQQLGIQENDLWIAATAVAADVPIVTNDRRDFERILEHVPTYAHRVIDPRP